jgi:hypothetical protein
MYQIWEINIAYQKPHVLIQNRNDRKVVCRIVSVH